MDQLLRRTGIGLMVNFGRNACRILQEIHAAQERSRQRRALARLSDGLLRDIGLTRHDAAREAGKPFWR